MKFDEEKFKKFILKTVSVGKEYDIDEDTMTSVLAEAIESELGNDQDLGWLVKSFDDVVELYGIPKDLDEMFKDGSVAKEETVEKEESRLK